LTAHAYPGTSFLASLYGEDGNSVAAVAECGLQQSRLVITPLAEFELVNAFGARVFRKESNAAQAQACIRAFESDLASGLFVRRTVSASAYERALSLSRKYTRLLGTRAMDILHVAIALELGAALFLTFDRAQKRLAHAAGMKVRPT
jgi:predicted nucleic acid-binding protein